MGGRTTLEDFVSRIEAAEPSRRQLDALIHAIAKASCIQSMQLLAWLLFEALAPQTQSTLAKEVREAWAPTEGRLARLLKLGGGTGLPPLLWLFERSEPSRALLKRLLDLTEQSGFSVPSGALEKLAAGPEAALRAERRRTLQRSFPELYQGDQL